MRIALLGDVCLSDRWAGKVGGDGCTNVFEHVRRKLGPEALLVANVEFAITDRGTRAGFTLINGRCYALVLPCPSS